MELVGAGVAGAVNVAVFPASIVTLKPPCPAVTVCCEVLSFFTVTVDPAATGVVVEREARRRS